jgi:hypothetical protein
MPVVKKVMDGWKCGMEKGFGDKKKRLLNPKVQQTPYLSINLLNLI